MLRMRMGEHAAKNGKCETKAKNIAQTGQKTIRYEESDKVAECTFNFSDDAGIDDRDGDVPGDCGDDAARRAAAA